MTTKDEQLLVIHFEGASRNPPARCALCNESWPCATNRLLNEKKDLQAELARARAALGLAGEALSQEHGEADYEPECPLCQALKVVEEALPIEARAALGETT